MATSYMDYAAPDTRFTYTLSDSPFFRKDNENYIDVLSVKQLNTLGNSSLLDIYLSTGNVVEPHIHQNASELVYCIAGSAVVSLINPFTNELLNYQIGPGQVANIPQGWWHYEEALQDGTHLLAIFDAPIPEVIFGSDILRLTPPKALAHAYCLDEAKLQEALAPLTSTVIIGPPKGCSKTTEPNHSGTGQYQMQQPQPLGTGQYQTQQPHPAGTVQYQMQQQQPAGTAQYQMQQPQPLGTGQYQTQQPHPAGTVQYQMQQQQPAGTAQYQAQPNYGTQGTVNTGQYQPQTMPRAYSQNPQSGANHPYSQESGGTYYPGTEQPFYPIPFLYRRWF